jgi:hypothetical protein
MQFHAFARGLHTHFVISLTEAKATRPPGVAAVVGGPLCPRVTERGLELSKLFLSWSHPLSQHPRKGLFIVKPSGRIPASMRDQATGAAIGKPSRTRGE